MADASGWDRAEVSLRLGKRRKARLAELARSMGPGATPTDAVDQAIDMALAREPAIAPDFGETQDAIAALAIMQRSDLDRIEAKLDRLAASVEALSDLIAAVASPDEY